jgi:hypothetical protein
MRKNRLQQVVALAAEKFALEIIAAVKASSLQELMSLTGKSAPAPKKGRPAAAKKEKAATPKKKRVVKNYPKCAFPGCKKNRFPRGKGYCGDHWRQWKEGKIPAAGK